MFVLAAFCTPSEYSPCHDLWCCTPVVANPKLILHFQQWASNQMRKIAVCTSTGHAGNVLSTIDLKGKRELAIPAYITPRASRWIMSGSLTHGGGAFPAHAQPALVCIWQDAHEPHNADITLTPTYVHLASQRCSCEYRGGSHYVPTRLLATRMYEISWSISEIKNILINPYLQC